MYDHNLSKSAVTNFSDFESVSSFRAFLFSVGVLRGVQGLPEAGEDEQNVGVANGEA